MRLADIHCPRLTLIAVLALSLACATGGARQSPSPRGAPDSPADSSDVDSQADAPDRGAVGGSATSHPGESDPADPKTQQVPGSPTAKERAASGAEAMIVGTVIGGQFGGPAGAAVGAAAFAL